MKYYITEYLDHHYGIEALEDPLALLSLSSHRVVKNRIDESILIEMIKQIKINEPLISCYYGCSDQEYENVFEIAECLNIDPLLLLKQNRSNYQINHPNLNQIINTISKEDYQVIKYDNDFETEIKDDIKKLIIYHRVPGDSLLGQFLKRKKYEFVCLNEVIDSDVLDLQIDIMDLRIRYYSCLKREGIENLKALYQYIKNNELSKVKFLGLKGEETVIAEFYQVVKNYSKKYSFSLVFKNSYEKRIEFDLEFYDINILTNLVYQELFKDCYCIFNPYDSIFSYSITTVLLWLGYFDLKDVLQDLEKLSNNLFDLKLIDDKNALKKSYRSYYHNHVQFYEITKEEFQRLKNNGDIAQRLKELKEKEKVIVDNINRKFVSFVKDGDYYDEEFMCDYSNDQYIHIEDGYIDYDVLFNAVKKMPTLMQQLNLINSIYYNHGEFLIYRSYDYYKQVIDKKINDEGKLDNEGFNEIVSDHFFDSSYYNELWHYFSQVKGRKR